MNSESGRPKTSESLKKINFVPAVSKEFKIALGDSDIMERAKSANIRIRNTNKLSLLSPSEQVRFFEAN